MEQQYIFMEVENFFVNYNLNWKHLKFIKTDKRNMSGGGKFFRQHFKNL